MIDGKKQFDDDDDSVSEIPHIIEDADHPQEELSAPKTPTYGISVANGELLFKVDNKTVKKTSIKSLKNLNLTDTNQFGLLLAEFRRHGADAAIKKFKSS